MHADPVPYSHWLIKAEPETRIEKGIDVRFSIDDLERNRTTTWEGVRNHEAKKYLKSQMKVGHTCLFYASNCKMPGVTGLARVIKEGYPDFNAWDFKHPYYDPKSKENDPTWFMVDVEFLSKLAHPVPLALLQSLAALAPSSSTSVTDPSLPATLSYLTSAHLRAIADSALIRRGRLSVQPVEEAFFAAVELLGNRGGWEEWEGAKAKKGAKGKKKAEDGKGETAKPEGVGAVNSQTGVEAGDIGEGEQEDKPDSAPRKTGRKARAGIRGTERKTKRDEEAEGVPEDEQGTTGRKRRAGQAEESTGVRRSKRVNPGP